MRLGAFPAKGPRARQECKGNRWQAAVRNVPSMAKQFLTQNLAQEKSNLNDIQIIVIKSEPSGPHTFHFIPYERSPHCEGRVAHAVQQVELQREKTQYSQVSEGSGQTEPLTNTCAHKPLLFASPQCVCLSRLGVEGGRASVCEARFRA